MKPNYRWIKRLIGILAVALFIAATQVQAAGTVTGLTDTMSRQKLSQASTHKFAYTTATTDAAMKKYQVTFPAGFGLGSFAGGVVKVGGADVSANGSWGAPVGQVVTWTYTTTASVNSSTAIELNMSGITNPSSSGSNKITVADINNSSTTVDSGQVAVPIATEDQVTVTGTVDPTITFTVTPTSVPLGTVTTSVTTVPETSQLQIGTNAPSGYTISGQGTTLTSGSNTIPFVTDGTVSASASEYGIAFTVGTCAGGTGTSAPGGDIGLASTTTVMTETGPVASCYTNASYKAAIASNQAAGAYTSTLTYLATGNF
jgi:hypothetical protein